MISAALYARLDTMRLTCNSIMTSIKATKPKIIPTIIDIINTDIMLAIYR